MAGAGAQRVLPRRLWRRLRLRKGHTFESSPVEAVGRMHAMLYLCKGCVAVADDRQVICTAHDVIGRVDLVHRCGTDVNIFRHGRPDQLDESLVAQLYEILDLRGEQDPALLEPLVRFLRDGIGDGTIRSRPYLELAERLSQYSNRERETLWRALGRVWGRILGHELVVTIVRVGSRVAELTDGIGYREGEMLTPDELAFQVGEQCVVQSRIARYRPPLPPARKPTVRGTQLLGGNITDLAMEQNGGYAQYVRLNRQIIQSGSIVRVPAGVDPICASMVEPAACLLDCLERSTHEAGQGERGTLLKKGVMPGGVAAIIGSGSMAIMAGMMALMDDPLIEVGGAAEVVFFVRSQRKADLVRGILADDRVRVVICTEDDRMREAALAQYAPAYRSRTGEAFRGFDDVIVAAGTTHTLAHAHRLIAPTGARVVSFAGVRGSAPFDAATWHYGNAGTVGSSGCNTKMMEIVLGLLQRKSLDLSKLSGREYSLEQLEEEGVAQFFDDSYLRPRLNPNAGLKEWNW